MRGGQEEYRESLDISHFNAAELSALIEQALITLDTKGEASLTAQQRHLLLQAADIFTVAAQTMGMSENQLRDEAVRDTNGVLERFRKMLVARENLVRRQKGNL